MYEGYEGGAFVFMIIYVDFYSNCHTDLVPDFLILSKANRVSPGRSSALLNEGAISRQCLWSC